MPSRPCLPHSSSRPPWARVWLCLSLVLAMLAAPWQPQANAWGNGERRDLPAMAICGATGGTPGNAPAHLAASHCNLCCTGQAATTLPPSMLLTAATAGMSYPLVAIAPASRSARLAPGRAQARAPPA